MHLAPMRCALPYTELYTALETGTVAVDGQENPNANIINAKFYEVQNIDADHHAVSIRRSS